MKVELDKREREIIITCLKNAPDPFFLAPGKREVEKLLKKLQNHT